MRSLRVLLVDDDASIGALLTELLEGMGHVVCGLEASEAGAVKAALRDKPDLMIVDARLREGNGLAAVDAILRVTPIPHIVMSGERIPVGRASRVRLQKPFMYRDLVHAITHAIAVVSISPS